jgi:hypothetical protein
MSRASPAIATARRPALAVLALGAVLLLGCAVGLFWPRLGLHDVVRVDPSGAAVTETLPWQIRAPFRVQQRFEAELDARGPGAVLRIDPEPCIAELVLGGRPVELEPLAGVGGCQHHSGFGLAIEPGAHRLSAVVASPGGTRLGLDLREQRGGTRHGALWALGLLGLAAVLAASSRLLGGLATRPWAPWAVGLGLLGLLGAYFLLAPPAPMDFTEVSTPYHRLLAEALLQGRVDLDTGGASYDLCAVGGRHYLCWGMMPAVLMMPVAWLVEAAPSGRVAGVAVGLLTGFTWFVMLFGLRRRGVLALGWVDLLLLTGFTLFGTQLWFLTASGEVWHLGQSFAIMLSSLALLCLLPRRLGCGVLACALFGAAALSRFSLMLLFPVFGVMALLLHLQGVDRWRGVLGRGLALAAPLFAALGAQFLYNRARFGALLDFGWRTQQGSDHLIHDLATGGTLSLAWLPRNIERYLLDPLGFREVWPPLDYTGHGNAVWSYQLGLFVLLAAVLLGLPRVPELLRGLRGWLLRVADRGDGGPAALGSLPTGRVLLWGSALAWAGYGVFLLLLFTTGWITVGCRLLANVLPFFLVLLACAWAWLPRGLAWRVALWSLLLISVLVQTWIKLMMV